MVRRVTYILVFPVELGKTPSVMVTIYTGRNSIDTMFVRLSSPFVGFKPQDAKLLNGEYLKEGCYYIQLFIEESCETFEVVDDKIRIVNADTDENVTLVVPHTEASSTAIVSPCSSDHVLR